MWIFIIILLFSCLSFVWDKISHGSELLCKLASPLVGLNAYAFLCSFFSARNRKFCLFVHYTSGCNIDFLHCCSSSVIPNIISLWNSLYFTPMMDPVP
jgi:hypothetical protein